MRDISSLDPRLLQAFIAIAEERGVSRAATRLGVTQQGLSGMLSRMRDSFEDPLFVRHGRGVVPTRRAEELVPKVKQVLVQLAQLVDDPSFNPYDSDEVITVGTTDYVLSVLVADVFAQLRVVAPGIRLSVRPIDSTSLLNELKGGRMDIALTVPEFSPQNVFMKTLYQERYVGVMRRGHPLAQEVSTLDGFCTAEHMLVSPDRGDFYGTTDTALEQMGRKRRVGLVMPSFSAAAAMLAKTDMISVLPARLCAHMSAELTSFTLPVEVPGFDLNAIWAERVHADPLHIWFRQLCSEVAKSNVNTEAHAPPALCQ